MIDKMAFILCIWCATRRTPEEESKKKMLRGKMTVPYKYTVKVKTQEERVLWALEDKAGTRANKPEGQYTY